MPRAFVPDVRGRARRFAAVPGTRRDRVADERAYGEMLLRDSGADAQRLAAQPPRLSADGCSGVLGGTRSIPIAIVNSVRASFVP
jgi:hypothetical protein